ncbi:glycosyl hydrolase family 85-domain-containing protein [Leucosporidium creatinivorum]|uniref:Glycosyl hydrolase family 85-domain-containing protein n=1 Tax=Leucosporidium creatinivorum TaxID=106004 RepID=A0A1Y2E603_9BASI|nr:glycosyl hydrolase family 85-domain-containing protein [Leucosporidium creatinivorum]
MVRAPGYSPTSPTEAPPDSFESLAELSAYFSTPRLPQLYAAPQIPYIEPRTKPSSRLVVCHDFKGGYCEQEEERGYTFPWWSLCDAFIYFSHRRVALPPPDWIRTAHRHGTKVLGTLIFEWDQGKLDLDRLLGPDLCAISTEVADRLVDLAVERGFEGWLVNVEVELGTKQSGPSTHAQALAVWLAYLRDETRRRVPGGETIWYDGANVEGVRWQNRLSSLNAPFFAAADGIFLNYWWRENHIEETKQMLEKLGRPRDEVSFGLDVWGRGQFGGGGFSSWRAVQLLDQSTRHQPPIPTLPPSSPSPLNNLEPPPSSLSFPLSSASPSDASNFSLALFAPAWTVESEHLGHSLETREGWTKWWEDELYLWTGSAPGPNVERERVRMEQVRKEERGVQRARELAAAFSISHSPPSLPSFDYNAPLPPLPGSFRPLASYRPAPRPPPPSSAFYTNFSNGAGHCFYLEGKLVLDSPSGWTDIDFTFPFPSLALPSPNPRVKASLTDDDAWMGAFSLRLEASKPAESSAIVVPVTPTAVLVERGQHLTATAVWKPLSTIDELKLAVNYDRPSSSTELAETSLLEMHDLDTTELAGGWRSTSALITLKNEDEDEAFEISSLGLSFTFPSSTANLLVGSLALTSSSLAESPQPLVTNLRWSSDSASLKWDVARAVPISSAVGSASESPARGRRWPSFLFYIISYHDDAGREVFLGTTASRRFRLARERLAEGGRIACRGVGEDGSLSQISCYL